MTRDEHRAKILDVMEAGFLANFYDGATQSPAPRPHLRAALLAAFDSLRGIVLAIPVEVDGYEDNGGWGDLTNPPEKKRD